MNQLEKIQNNALFCPLGALTFDSNLVLYFLYEALMLLNFCEDPGRGSGVQFEENFMGSKVLNVYLKLSLAKKISQNHPCP